MSPMPDAATGEPREPAAAETVEGLPPDLLAVLRDQSVVVSKDAAVFEVIGRWAKAPSNTASADLPDGEAS